MSIRTRAGLTAVLLAAITVSSFGALAYLLFARQQEVQLEQLLLQDLERVASLLAQPILGASLPEPQAGGYILQLVTPEGEVAVAWGREVALPLVDEPTRVQLDGRSFLLAVASGRTEGATIRLAHDVTVAVQAREQLLRSLALGGFVIAVLAGLLGLVSTSRLLAPLHRVADRARQLDPARPEAIEIAYAGPEDEVADLVGALNTALENIRRRKDEERMFLTEIAHELASPLTLVSYHLDQARARHEDPSLDAAAGAAKELLRTSQDLLVLSRGDLDRPLARHVLDVSSLVRGIAREYPGLATPAGDTIEVVGDPERLMQAVRNVVRNGIQAARSPEAVEVTLRRRGAWCELLVRDEGPGMSDEVRARVFDRMYSGTQGTGVGLSIAKTIVEQHGGVIDVQSALGEGTTFVLRLPALEARAAETPADTLAPP